MVKDFIIVIPSSVLIGPEATGITGLETSFLVLRDFFYYYFNLFLFFCVLSLVFPAILLFKLQA